MSATTAAEPKAESIPIRIPFPVDPSLLLMFMTMLVRSCGRLRHDVLRSVGICGVGVGVGWKDVRRVVESEAVGSSSIVKWKRLVTVSIGI